MAKKNKKTGIPKLLIILLIITGICTLTLNILNRRLQITELKKVAGLFGTVFTIILLIIVGIWLVNYVKKRQ